MVGDFSVTSICPYYLCNEQNENRINHIEYKKELKSLSVLLREKFYIFNVFLPTTTPENICESQSIKKSFQTRTYSKGYKCSYYKCWVKDMVLEGEQCQSHVGEDEILCQEIEKLKQLKTKFKRLVQ